MCTETLFVTCPLNHGIEGSSPSPDLSACHVAQTLLWTTITAPKEHMRLIRSSSRSQYAPPILWLPNFKCKDVHTQRRTVNRQLEIKSAMAPTTFRHGQKAEDMDHHDERRHLLLKIEQRAIELRHSVVKEASLPLVRPRAFPPLEQTR